MRLNNRKREAARHAAGTRGTGPRLPSTQERVVALSEVRQDILCLQTSAAHTSSRSRGARGGAAACDCGPTLYRAVLEATSINFSLKATSEQEGLLAGYRAFLNGLAFPVQLLIRIRPLDLEPYLERLTCRDGAMTSDTDHGGQSLTARAGPSPAMPDETASHATLCHLAADHAVFVRHLARHHTLLERHFYVIIPADVTPHSRSDTLPATTDTRSPGSRSVLGRALRGVLPAARRAREVAEASARFDAIAQRLDLRVGEVVRHLARFGVEARRLEGDQLVALYYSCLSPNTATAHPLPAAALVASLPPVQCAAAPSHGCIDTSPRVTLAGEADESTEAQPTGGAGGSMIHGDHRDPQIAD